MKAKFIEGADHDELAVQFEPETDEERLLLRTFAYQAAQCENRLLVQGWGVGGTAQVGLRHVKVYLDKGGVK